LDRESIIGLWTNSKGHVNQKVNFYADGTLKLWVDSDVKFPDIKYPLPGTWELKRGVLFIKYIPSEPFAENDRFLENHFMLTDKGLIDPNTLKMYIIHKDNPIDRYLRKTGEVPEK